MRNQSLQYIEEVVDRYPSLSCCHASMEKALIVMTDSFRSGGRMLVCGNGGSAADSLHIVGELMKGFILPRPLDGALRESLRRTSPGSAEYLIQHLQKGLPAVSLVSEIGLSTAFANDCAADLVFAQQVLALGTSKDTLFAISTSGSSPNVLYAADTARALGMSVIGLSGKDGGSMPDHCDVVICVPESETRKIQELHLPVYHALCLALEEEFFGNRE